MTKQMNCYMKKLAIWSVAKHSGVINTRMKSGQYLPSMMREVPNESFWGHYSLLRLRKLYWNALGSQEKPGYHHHPHLYLNGPTIRPLHKSFNQTVKCGHQRNHTLQDLKQVCKKTCINTPNWNTAVWSSNLKRWLSNFWMIVRLFKLELEYPLIRRTMLRRTKVRETHVIFIWAVTSSFHIISTTNYCRIITWSQLFNCKLVNEVVIMLIKATVEGDTVTLKQEILKRINSI